jgi:hypothetical protein
MGRSRLLFLGLLVVLGAGGCGASIATTPVEGTLTLDGKPIGKAVVIFSLDGEGSAGAARSVGQTDEQGRFRLRTESGQEGAVPGQHRVTVEDLSWYDAPRDAEGSVTKLPKRRFPAIYSDPLQTPFRVTIQANSQPVELKMRVRPGAVTGS